jgi:hypothetical protein
VLIAVALVGGGTASALVLTRHQGSPQAGQAAGKATPSTVPATPSTAPAVPSTAPATPVATSPPPSSTAPSVPPAGGTGNSQVEAAQSIAADSQTPQVLAFLDSYFTAINNHSYRDYRALLNPAAAQALTYPAFQNGYATTRDSAEKLHGISAAGNGDTVASVTFTSHQDAANSVDGSGQTCTRWDVLLYLQQDGDGYLLGKSPPGYHAAYAAC